MSKIDEIIGGNGSGPSLTNRMKAVSEAIPTEEPEPVRPGFDPASCGFVHHTGAPSDNGKAHGADFQKENSTAREPEVNPDLTEIGESPGVTEGAPPSSSAEADSFGIYYVLDGKTWRVRNKSGEWIPTGVEAVRRELWIEKEYSIKSEKGRASEVEQVLHLLEMNCYVDFVGQYAGYLSAGRQEPTQRRPATHPPQPGAFASKEGPLERYRALYPRAYSR
jgi:hypothetical protein